MMELLSLFLLTTISLLQLTYGADSNVVDERNKCQKTTLDGSLNTKILLRDQCNTSGKIDWLLLNSNDGNDGSSAVQGVATSVYADDGDITLSHIIQFRKAGQQSFTVCLTFPDLEDKRVPPFSVHHLRGKSKKQIRSPASVTTNGVTTIIPSPSAIAGSPVCIASQCSHVSLMLQTSAMGVAAAAMANNDQGSILQGRRSLSDDWPAMDAGIRSQRSHQKNSTPPGNINVAVGIKYQFALDQRCPKCTDQCMKNIFCSSSYMFVGTVTSSEQISEDGRSYKSVIKLERYIKHDNRFTEHSGIKSHPSCEKTTPSSSDVIHHTTLPINRKVVTVYSTCYLKLTGRYLISANYRAGLKNKGRLAVACAQEDIDYSLYVLKNIQ